MPWSRACIFALLGLLLWTMPGAAQLTAILDTADPLWRDLGSWWRGVPGLTGGNTLFDLGPLGNDATLVNMGFGTTSGWASTDRQGGFLHVAFDGTDDYGTIGTMPAYECTNTTCTVSLWFKTTTSGVQQYLVAKRTVSGGAGDMTRVDAANTVLVSLRNDAGNASSRNTTTTVTDGLWHHVVGVLTSDTITAGNNAVSVYLDGVLNQGAASGTAVYTAPSGATLTLGVESNLTAGTYFAGAMVAIQFWARALDDAEVATLYQRAFTDDVEPFRPLANTASVVGKPGTFFPFFSP